MVASPDPQSKALMSLQERYPATKFNLLLPTLAEIDVSQWHRMAVSIVNISPDPRKGDVYEISSRAKETPDGNLVKIGNEVVYEPLFALARPAKDRIGTAAGISYDTEETKILRIAPDYVMHQTVGGVRRPDGSWVAFKATKEIDLIVIDMELREAATKKLVAGIWGKEAERAQQLYRGRLGPDPNNAKWQRFYIDPVDMSRAIDDLVRPQIIQWRKNKAMRAETGSRGRVITHLLGIPTHFTREELLLPFAIPRIDFVPPMDDPDVKRAVIAKAVEAYGSLYGGRGGSDRIIIPKDAVQDLGSDDAMDAEFRVMGEEPGPAAQAENQAAAARPVETKASPVSQVEAPTPPEPEDDGTHCKGCGVEVTDNVAKYSKQKYGRELCWNCQKSGGPAS